MRVLIACEFSGVVRRAFRAKGHDAWSCDLIPSADNSPYHIQGNVLLILNQGWDMMIAHDPCTYQCNSGVCHLYNKDGSLNTERWRYLDKSCVFTRKLFDAPIKKIARENPIPHKYAVERIGRKYDQIVQPWMFGHPECKATCFWLFGLPKLKPTNNVKEQMLKLPRNLQQRLHYLSPSEDRAKIRSTTFQGIADAMAEQWN